MKIQTTGTGFTLIELLVVIALMVLSVSVVPAYFGNIIESTRMKSAARRLAVDLKVVRDQAIIHQKDSVFTLDVDKARYTVGNINKPFDLPDKTRITLTTGVADSESPSIGSIRFFPDGSSSGGRIVLVHDTTHLQIDVSWLTGKIAILD